MPKKPACISAQSTIRPWSKLAESTLQKTVVFDILTRRMRSPDGDKEVDFYSIECRDWVNVIAITTTGEVLLVEQFRHGIQNRTLELPGGIVGSHHTPAQAALAELEEETGFTSTDIRPLGSFHPNPAIQTNLAHFFVAVGCKPMEGGQRLDDLEDINVRACPLKDLASLIDSGQVSHCLTLAALYQARNRHPDLGF
jgi:ADP-ribose pyrophosphatase